MAYEVTTANSALEFDTQNCVSNACFVIDSNHFINFWGGGANTRLTFQAFAVNTSTWAVTTANSSLENASIKGYENNCEQIDANHFIVFSYDMAVFKWWASIVAVNTTTFAVTTATAPLEFGGGGDGQYGDCAKVDANHFIVFYCGLDADGFAQVFTVNTTTWAVTTASSALEFDTQYGNDSNCCKVDTNHFINFWRGVNDDGFVQVFTVNTTTWATTTAGAVLEFDTQTNYGGVCYKIDDTHFINFWTGLDSDGFVQVFAVNTTTWEVTTAGSVLEFDTTNNASNSCYQVDANHFIDFWRGALGDGFAQVFTVNTSTWAVTTSAATLEFDTQENIHNSCYQIDTNHFINFWQGLDGDGFAQVFAVAISQSLTATYTEVIKIVSPVATKVHIFYKTLTDSLRTVGSMLKTTGKLLLSSLKVVPNFIRSTAKTLISIIKVLPNLGKTTGRLLIDSIKVLSLKVFNFGRSIIEKVITSDLTVDIIKLILKILSESITILSNILFNIGKIISNSFKVISNKIITTGISLLESFQVSQLYSKVLLAYRTMTESIIVLENKLVEIGKTFVGLIKVREVYAQIYGRTLTQTLSVLSSIGSFIINKVLKETLIVNWEKLTFRSKLYIERIIVNHLSIGLKTSRTFVERVIGSTEWLFEKIQFTELSERIIVSVSFLKIVSKVFIELVLMAIEQLYKATTTVLYETIKIVETGIFLFGHVLYETFNAIDSMGNWVVAKVIVQIVRIRQFVGNATSWSMSEVLRVSDSILNIANKVLLEVLNVIEVRLTSIGKVLIQPLKALDLTRFKKTQYRILSDVIYVSGEAFNATGKVFIEVLDTIGELGSWAIGKLIVNPIIIVGEFTKNWTLSRILSETISVVSNWIGIGAKVLNEIIAIIPDLARMLPTKMFYETIRVVDTIAKSLPKTFVESIAVTGSIIHQTAKTFIEVINVIGTFVIDSISKLLNEIIGVVEIYTKEWTLSRLFTEFLVTVDRAFKQPGKTFSEVLNTTGTFVLGTISKVLIEIVKVFYIVPKAMSRIFTSVISVGSDLTKYTFGRLFNEVVQVINPTITKLTGRTFNELIILGKSKIKLVLNGIQVGLWKKVARVTNGIWKKISRNDN